MYGKTTGPNTVCSASENYEEAEKITVGMALCMLTVLIIYILADFVGNLAKKVEKK